MGNRKELTDAEPDQVSGGTIDDSVDGPIVEL